jgi:hypothetical protein
MWRGEFIVPRLGLRLPNLLTTAGEAEFLKMIFRADVATIAAGGNFYIGLCNIVPAKATTFAAVVATEPTIATNGYARAAITRDATGWPTAGADTAGSWLSSANATFTASGGAFDEAFTRLFLASAATGSTGTLFAISAALPAALTLEDTESFVASYRGYLG